MASMTPAATNLAYPYPLILVTSSDKKVREVQDVVGSRAHITRVDAVLREDQENDAIATCRLRGPEHYPAAAGLSMQLKYTHLARECTLSEKLPVALQPGLTLMDSAWFQVARQGLPGITVKQEFAGTRLEDGTEIENNTAPVFACEMAKILKDCRVVWVETAATIEPDPQNPDIFMVKYRQSVAECYTPPTPRGQGWAYDVCCCPDPIVYARYKGRHDVAERLAAIKDKKWQLPLEAEKLGCLVTFAELEERGLKHIFSPRADLFRQFIAPKEERRKWPV